MNTCMQHVCMCVAGHTDQHNWDHGCHPVTVFGWWGCSGKHVQCESLQQVGSQAHYLVAGPRSQTSLWLAPWGGGLVPVVIQNSSLTDRHTEVFGSRWGPLVPLVGNSPCDLVLRNTDVHRETKNLHQLARILLTPVQVNSPVSTP